MGDRIETVVFRDFRAVGACSDGLFASSEHAHAKLHDVGRAAKFDSSGLGGDER
jgi:hypothetical protein